MLLIGLISLLLAIPLYSSTITPTLLTRITSITLLFSAALSFNALYVQAIGSGLGLYSGLFHVTSVTQAMEVFLFTVGAFVLLPWASSYGNNALVQGASEKSIAFHGNAGELASSSTTTSAVPTIAEYPLIILFTTIGASFLISSSDLVSMYLSIELQSFAVYILASIYRNSESATSAGLKYFLLGALSSALILLGSSIIYAYTGLTSFEGIYMIANVAFPVGSGEHSSTENIYQGIVLGVLIIGVGFLFKVAAAPFHNWAPDVYDGVPTIVTTWLTVMPKISIFVFLLELQIGSETTLMLSDITMFPISDGADEHSSSLIENNQTAGNLEGLSSLLGFTDQSMNIWKNLLLTTSLLSLVVGTVVGLAQYRLKRLLAFSTISHVGFLLLALSVNSEESISSFLFYLMQYSITNLNAFFVVLAFGYLIHSAASSVVIGGTPMSKNSNFTRSPAELGKEVGKTSDFTNGVGKNADISFISQLKGQFHANPILGLSLAICLFSMAGIPPLVGFFAKYRVLYSAIENGYYFLALVGILASVVSAAYYLRIIRVIHFDVPNSLASDANTSFPKHEKDVADRSTFQTLFPTGGRELEKDQLTSTHSYVIAVLTLFITLFILSPSLFLNSSNLLALSLFTA